MKMSINNSMDESSQISGYTTLEWVLCFWQKKFLIVITTLIFAVAGVSYAYYAQSWWTSTAVITTNKARDIRIFSENIDNLYVNSGVGGLVSQALDEKRLLRTFVNYFNAYNNKLEFLEGNKSIKSDFINEKEKHDFLQRFIKRINSEKVGNDSQVLYSLSYTATSSIKSHDLLSEYINFINEKVNKEVVSSLKSDINNQMKRLTESTVSLKINAEVKQHAEILKTDYALKIAEAADLKKPIAELGNSQIFNIEIGTDGLKEKSLILHNSKDLALFEPQIDIAQAQINFLKDINLEKAKPFNAYRFVKDVSYPMSQAYPSKLIIILFSIIFGFSVGCFLVLLKLKIKK
ncbi:O-antigen chain length determinant protein [Photobacterium angustum S14]|uniref:O-antigen chain length determinant protein n=2 Tax=Photobacterium angustum TaxID=661 RepID=Q1ZRK1_PHOAS|nr:O-antigen chain length determinant protein [Photobacterium angustum S14]